MEGILFPGGVPEGLEGLDAYRARGGYQAVERLAGTSPEDIVAKVEASGLRGRGGAGFPTGRKLALTLECPETPRYVVMNGGEDEPGSKKDRVLMENVPHLILDGIILAAYAVQAEKAYLYINHGYEAATRAMETAIEEARQAGYCGADVAGSGFSLEIVMVPAPSNYVAGEDTAALEVIEGKEALPRQKPPFPVTEGLFGKPSLVNNVETLANIAPIVNKGPESFRAVGTADSPGTMVFSLGDEMERPGVYELPLGTPLRHLVEGCGGGLKHGKAIKAILPGGPSSGFLLPESLDLPLDHNSLREAGSSIGCGVVKVLTEDDSVLDEVVRIADFFARESCGQCPACRMETNMLVALLKKVQAGEGNDALVEQFGKVIAFNKGKGFCSLINMPGPPIESAVRLFPEEFRGA
ncbi:MAG: SLBB domain-containing protein [Deltaproteobacteria bacterium]|nr:SLBB domain-containing protein [Deltaproteobacteria bacterium]